ncbi:MAG: hypothetical protein V1889_00555 [archaeon]
MKSSKGIIGSFVSLFVATIVIVIILVVMIVASGIVKKIVQREDSFGVQGEVDIGVDDVFDYADKQFNNMTQLRIVVEKNGDWKGWLSKEMGR